MKITVACCLWDPNEKSEPFSRCYDETWVEKLFRAFQRHLTIPHDFVVFTDRERTFSSGTRIGQERLVKGQPDYGCLIEPFKLDVPTIVCGLDMVVLGNLDHFGWYCLEEELLAMPRNPYDESKCINPIVLAPAGNRSVFSTWSGQNDMEWLRRFRCNYIDDRWPGQVLSYKAHEVAKYGVRDARIVYFHGDPKPPVLKSTDWIAENWT